MKLRKLLTEMKSPLKVGNQPIDRDNSPERYIKRVDAYLVEI